MREVAVLAGCALFALAGCVHDNLLTCGDQLCNADQVCYQDRRCVAPDQVAQCDGMTDGTPCTAPKDGHCIANICERCGRVRWNDLDRRRQVSGEWVSGTSGHDDFVSGDFTDVQHWNGTYWSRLPVSQMTPIKVIAAPRAVLFPGAISGFAELVR